MRTHRPARAATAACIALLATLASVASPVAADGDAASRGLAFDTGWSHDENSGDGYAYFAGETFVDCAHTRVGHRQSADVFTGAYAHDAGGRVVSYVDAGILLQNDALRPGELGRPDKVQLYGQASTTASAALLRYGAAPDAAQSTYHVACDTSLTVAFAVVGPGEVVVTYDGTFVAKATGRRGPGRLTARIAGFVPADGWSAACARCAVRRVDTLAVGSGAPTRPGSYAGVLDVLGTRKPVLRWTHCVEGRYRGGPPGEAASYALRPFHASPRDVVDAPADAETAPAGRPAFLVRREGTADERLGLDERDAR